MPRSKHRRKPGGKAVPHPGRGKQPMTHPDPEIVLWRRFRDAYSQPFQDDSAPPGAGFLLDLIADAAFNMTGNGSLRPVSKADVFGEFMQPPASTRWRSGKARCCHRNTRHRNPPKLRWPSLSNRAWWRSQATRSPCQPVSGAADSLPPPDPTHGTSGAAADGSADGAGEQSGVAALRMMIGQIHR